MPNLEDRQLVSKLNKKAEIKNQIEVEKIETSKNLTNLVANKINVLFKNFVKAWSIIV